MIGMFARKLLSPGQVFAETDGLDKIRLLKHQTNMLPPVKIKPGSCKLINIILINNYGSLSWF